MKKLISVILSVVLILSAVSVCAFASEENGNILASGYCGAGDNLSNVQYVLYDDGTLVLSGSGATTSPDNFGEFAYSYRELIKRVVLEEGITEVESGSFRQFEGTEEIIFPESLKKIGFECFSNIYECYVNIPATVEEIGDFSFAFSKGISVDSENLYYTSDEYGVLFNKDKTELVVYPSNSDIEVYNVPDGIEKIHMTGMYCQNLRKISFPASVKEIGDGCFYVCTSLESVEFSEGLETLGEANFMMCENLTSVVLPSTLKKIGTLSFFDCYFLTDITVKSISPDVEMMSLALVSMRPAEGVSDEAWLEMFRNAFALEPNSDGSANAIFWENSEVFENYEKIDDAVIYIHDDSEYNTVEEYAEVNSVTVEKIHFYGEWVYDWDNYVRTKQCELCDMTITEELEKDIKDDVEIVAPDTGDADFEVDNITDTNDGRYVLAKDAVADELENEVEIVKMIDINLKNSDGVHVQPDGTVKVKLPGDWKHENYKVYRLNDDGTLTDMNAYLQGSHLVFETDHFSIYIVAEEVAADDSAEIPSNTDVADTECVFVSLIRKFVKFLIEILRYFGIVLK